jgi:hypothetical protein
VFNPCRLIGTVGEMMSTTKNKLAGERTQCTIDKVEIEWLSDDSPDLSWLDQTDAEMGQGFEAQSKERKQSYGQTWEMLGVRARARISYPWQDNLGVRLEYFTSGGLWGIESDMDDQTRQDYELEQLQDLVSHLSHFGIKTTVRKLQELA